MASSSRNSAAMPQPLAGNHSFQPGQLSRVEQTENDLRKLVGGIAALKEGAPLGKDIATMAGYDAQKLHKASAILKEVHVAEGELNTAEGGIGLFKKAIIAGQRTTQTGVDLQDKAARRRAIDRVVGFVAGSDDNTRIFYSGMGVAVTPATTETAQNNLRELAVSNTDPPARGSNPAKDIAALKKAVDDNRTISAKYKKERDGYKMAWEASRKQNGKLTTASEQQSRDLFKAKQDLEKARREYPQLERDKANRNESYLKAQVCSAQEKAREAEERAQMSEDDNIDLEKRHKEVFDSLKALRPSHIRQAEEISRLKRESEGQKKKLEDNERLVEAARAEVGRLESELNSSRDVHLNEMRDLRAEKDEADKRYQQVCEELRETKIAHSNGATNLVSANEKVSQVRGRLEALQLTIEEQRRGLETKDQRIRELERASEEKDASITQRDETINTQIQSASTFLRYLSSNVESDTWKCVAERVLVDSTSTSLTLDEWPPWVIFPSWSGDMSLATWEDTRSHEAVALSLLVILRERSADEKDLLALLHQLQNAMKKFQSMVATIGQLLLEAFEAAVGDPRLHLMHRFAMCQIASLLGSTAQVQHFMQSMDAADPRIRRLVHALGAYRLNNSVFPMEEAISYPGVALVGFNRDPEGIIAVSPSDNGVCWVDRTNIRTEFTVLKVVSGKGQSLELPLDTAERVDWAMTHA
ncbi:hypothetical protein F52700_2481 [Fusarium sp. NRRL 52700]|nr:hypothetical protein F52700_2481 [Fusarium sp. NRRL 52700]